MFVTKETEPLRELAPPTRPARSRSDLRIGIHSLRTKDDERSTRRHHDSLGMPQMRAPLFGAFRSFKTADLRAGAQGAATDRSTSRRTTAATMRDCRHEPDARQRQGGALGYRRNGQADGQRSYSRRGLGHQVQDGATADSRSSPSVCPGEICDL